jgi:hypothetical protein
MFNLKEKLLSQLGEEEKQPYQLLNFGGEFLYVVGLKKIIKFSSDEIVVKVKSDKKIVIKGSDFFIREISYGGVLICGIILGTEVV